MFAVLVSVNHHFNHVGFKVQYMFIHIYDSQYFEVTDISYHFVPKFTIWHLAARLHLDVQ